MINNLIKVLIIMLLMIALASCGVSPTPSSLAELQKPFGISTNEQQIQPQNYNIFIDVSGSMKGFFVKDSEFLNLINTLISKLPEDEKNKENQDEQMKFFVFGNDIKPLKGDLKSSLHAIADQKYYNQKTTDLNLPFEYILGDQRSINLIITDGVQSTRFAGQDQVIFSKNLKQYLGNNGFFAFMGIQTQYEGKYPSESNGSSITLNKGGKRPLYCLAFGNRKYSKFIREKISEKFDEVFEFGNQTSNELSYFIPPGITMQKGFTRVGENPKIHLTRYQLTEPTKELNIWLKGYEDRFGKTIDYFVAYKGKVDSTYKVIFKSDKALVTDVSETGKYISLKLPFPFDSKGNYLIRMTFRKTLPKWIQEWDTTDDSKIDNQTKTYRLKPWMESILNSFDDYSFLSTTEYYIHIKRK